MNETDELVCYDLFLRHTNKAGEAYVVCHRVWDGERFFNTVQADCRREGGKADVQMITEQQYLKERK